MSGNKNLKKKSSLKKKAVKQSSIVSISVMESIDKPTNQTKPTAKKNSDGSIITNVKSSSQKKTAYSKEKLKPISSPIPPPSSLTSPAPIPNDILDGLDQSMTTIDDNLTRKRKKNKRRNTKEMAIEELTKTDINPSVPMEKTEIPNDHKGKDFSKKKEKEKNAAKRTKDDAKDKVRCSAEKTDDPANNNRLKPPRVTSREFIKTKRSVLKTTSAEPIESVECEKHGGHNFSTRLANKKKKPVKHK